MHHAWTSWSASVGSEHDRDGVRGVPVDRPRNGLPVALESELVDPSDDDSVTKPEGADVSHRPGVIGGRLVAGFAQLVAPHFVPSPSTLTTV